jgi:hypothetical protein
VSSGGVYPGWNELGFLHARAVSRQGTAALGQQGPHLRPKDPQQVTPLSRWGVEFIRNLGDRLLQRGKTALQLGLPAAQDVDLRLKVTMAHPYPRLVS